ncbi:MAG: carboxylate--amine ligase [Acidobacteriota bacterium]
MQSSAQVIENPSAVVIGLDCVTGLQTARILASRGVPVIAIAKDPTHYCCRTRVCRKILFADTASLDFVTTLRMLGRELGAKAVLFPCTDTSVLLLSRHRHLVRENYHVVLPERDVVETLIDKIRFYTFAQEKGLPVPRTFLLKSRPDAEKAARSLTFPCILKPPIKTPGWERETRQKVFKATHADEFLVLYDRCRGWVQELMVQEWIEGPDGNLYTCNCYFDAHSRPLVTFVSRKVRQWPPETGMGCLAVECRNDEVQKACIGLFRSVGYRGLGYIEMKRHRRDGKHYIIEPNIGRPTGRSAIAEAGGVELLYTQYCETVGRPLPPNLHQPPSGVKWVHLRRDLQSALYYWCRGDLTLKEWWRSWRGRKACALFSVTDPAPFFHDLFRIGRLLLGGKRRRRKMAARPTRALRPVRTGNTLIK